jgi:predicted amidohydrolase
VGEARREWNLSTAVEYLNEAGARGSDIACLGETVNTMGIALTAQNLSQWAEAVPGLYTEALGAVARRFRMVVICPIHAHVDGAVRNVAVVLGRGGEVIGWYAKVHCTQGERSYGVTPGSAWPVFDLDCGRIGIQICHDNSFPEAARCLALAGAEIVFWPHVQSGWGDLTWDAVLRTRAIDNHLYLVAACYGTPVGRAWRPGLMTGRSGVVAPDGTVLVDAGRYPGVATTTIDLDRPRIAQDFTRPGEHPFWPDVLADRRPETFGRLVEDS